MDSNSDSDYEKLSKEELISKIKDLEGRLSTLKVSKLSKDLLQSTSGIQNQQEGNRIDLMTTPAIGKKLKHIKQQSQKKFEFKKYPTRKIALQIVYQGWNHGGLAWQPEITPLTTVEGELFKALLSARLVEMSEEFQEEDREEILKTEEWREAVDLEGWEYSRAGRTDAGVSGSGQVVSLWVRSNLLDSKLRQELLDSKQSPPGSFRDPEGFERSTDEENEEVHPKILNSSISNKPQEELPYISILNSLLPESIKVIAWSPVSTEFDARFSCKGRHYKYFFTKFESDLNQSLDIEMMREGAKKLIGEHDFRNLCKLDKSKQIENFKREIYSAEINLVDENAIGPEFNKNDGLEGSVGQDGLGEKNQMYVFDLRGSAFLYNQVRNIMAILFLIGSRLESPNLIDGLLYTDSSAQKPEGLGLITDEFVDRKPEMAIASELPLLLWDCIYPPNTFNWKSESVYKSNGIAPSKTFDTMRIQSTRYRIKSILTLHQIQKLQSFYQTDDDDDHQITPSPFHKSKSVCQIFGAGQSQWTKNYKSILNRPRLMIYSESNQKWLEGKGARMLAKRSAV
ncbi:uncharacterized protein MELLADRAFT_76951 [Melampsora larici-populina 98AG31]|uniref:Pseudouridine synthase I TruA alpha/beta domain-containing protein n=1 Tax=Melampsora larici-populina (strain 98AG31 / pathotype 3-4-7) TaxID=747676 RepID=F4RBL7_MELLP|nr:uncharacterized protein MELLADRAFT_76951 [Melampsora larici-populina 98AG31]EGG10313.1 hypothetical protein MELLADRAFT_76951 [Melampsora larici-populina 98AG31]